MEESHGVEESKKLHLHFASDENTYVPKGINDNTHLSVLGTTEISKIFIKESTEQKHPLAKYIK